MRPAPLSRLARAVAAPLFALVVSVVIGGLLMAALGRNPFAVYAVLIAGSLEGWPNLSVTLQLTTPLIFTGLAVAVAFRSGIWNIGVEGQMLMGALAAGIVGYAAPLPDWAMVPACLLASVAGGAAWAAIPALLRAYIGVNELVVCLMLNPIALLLTGYVSARVLKAPGPTNKLPDIVDAAHLTNFTLYSQLNSGIFIALACCVLMAAFNVGTVRGFEWKLIGLKSAVRELRRDPGAPQRHRGDARERCHRRPRGSRTGPRRLWCLLSTTSRPATASTASRWRCWPIRIRSGFCYRLSCSAR